MKNKIYFILILITNFAFCQSGSIIYSVKIDSSASQDIKKYRELIDKMIEYANNQKFELQFNKSNSIFKICDVMSKDPMFNEKENRTARLALTSGFDFFIDSSKRIDLEIKANNQLVESGVGKINWDITTESKSISNYLCYKAIKLIPFVDRYGENKTKQVVAWFAPSLPFPFGPKNFYGLPGLILELHENKTTYLATKIVLTDKEFKIDFPKGKTIPKEEYDKKLKAQMGM
ncbi:GLPGLI family protein [Flavobacterium sp. 9R]|jgi:GLPGLI family protein|uniref:GLPGLI family protein n=1 Tax=Flavobacterium sp. 9R TaxID=2653143 RepID=UPI0012EFE7ED|nr:GLPGLI family protein [Flavobacterium sp. 9R]VXB06757.1 GLPGLI family protein [Flavobacterium sp. 9R]